MSVWVTIPSARPPLEVEAFVEKWRKLGYLVALRRDLGAVLPKCDHIQCGEYHGYAKAVNGLIRDVIRLDSGAQWFVAAGDDITPDQTKRADDIEAECIAHFSGSFGCMQPTGDPWADAHGRMIERIAGSPWIGREFADRTYGGRGPYFEGYTHCFLDNEIMDVAKILGVFWQRPDLTHYHAHWTREKRPMPPYLREANSKTHWRKFRELYLDRKLQGFPGHEVLPEVLA